MTYIQLARLLYEACPVDTLYVGSAWEELSGRERTHWEDMAIAAMNALVKS